MVENVYTQRVAADRPDVACPITALGEAFNPFADPYISDPYAFYARARAEEPVFYSPGIDHWVVSRYEHVKAMLHDTECYSSRNAQTPIKPWPEEAVALLTAQKFRLMPNLSNNDPPSHTQVRRFLNDAFTPKRIKWLEPHVRRIVNEAIDDFIGQERIDLVKELFYETPARVLFTFLGIPESDIEKVKAWSAGRALLTWGKLGDEAIIAQMPTFIEYIQYCYDLVERLDKEPGDDYTSELLHKLKTEQPEGMDKDRIAITIFGLLMAGHETTTNQSGNGLRALLQHHEAWAALCQDSGLIPNAVEEIIRHESSVVAWRRVAKRDVTVAGSTIPAGAQILVLLGAANRDESQFAAAETFDIYRKEARRHLSFGHGIHYCLGAPLARLELKIFLEELTRRLPDMRLVGGQQYQYSPNTSHRGPTTLFVELNGAGSATD